VDGHEAVREGLRVLLAREGFEVCGEAADAGQALAGAADTSPNVAVVGLNLPEGESLSLIAELSQRGLPVVAYCAERNWRRIEGSFAVGALGFVCKAEPSSALLTAVRQALIGERHLSEQAGRCLAEGMCAGKQPEPPVKFSERESRVLTLLGEAQPTDEIAAELSVSPHTVTSYCRRIIDKAGLTGMKALRQYAVRRRLQDAS
jgi:DNA-binding NarL/FixJ family response regulator